MQKLPARIGLLALGGTVAFAVWTWYRQADPVTELVNAK